MKKLYFLIITLICFQSIHAQKNADLILGKWQTGSGNAHVEIYKNGNTYQGKIVWLSEPIDPETKKPKTDTKHPDASLHQGHIYDPKNGKEYKCNISFKDKNTLNVRGYIGFSMIGRTDVWTRVK